MTKRFFSKVFPPYKWVTETIIYTGQWETWNQWLHLLATWDLYCGQHQRPDPPSPAAAPRRAGPWYHRQPPPTAAPTDPGLRHQHLHCRHLPWQCNGYLELDIHPGKVYQIFRAFKSGLKALKLSETCVWLDRGGCIHLGGRLTQWAGHWALYFTLVTVTRWTPATQL